MNIKRLYLYYHILLASVLLVPKFVVADVLNSISRISFTENGKILLVPAESVSEVKTKDSSMNLFITNSAAQSCQINAKNLIQNFPDLNRSNSSVWTTLDILFENSFEKIKSKDLKIVIDDFSTQYGNSVDFSSYFLRSPTQMIGLDCSSELSQAYWPASLVHEIAHALLVDTNAPSWLDEGLSQLLERQIGGMQPVLNLRNLQKKTSGTLSVINYQRPIPSEEVYALGYLFVQYIYDVFGGWPALKGLARYVPDESNISTRVSQAANNIKGVADLLLSADKLTVKGLFRHFYMALSMKNSGDKRFKISNWKGFDQLQSLAQLPNLQSLQAIVFDHTRSPEVSDIDLLEKINLGYEVYRVYESNNGDHKIVTVDADFLKGPQNIDLKFTPTRAFTLVINLN